MKGSKTDAAKAAVSDALKVALASRFQRIGGSLYLESIESRGNGHDAERPTRPEKPFGSYSNGQLSVKFTPRFNAPSGRDLKGVPLADLTESEMAWWYGICAQKPTSFDNPKHLAEMEKIAAANGWNIGQSDSSEFSDEDVPF